MCGNTLNAWASVLTQCQKTIFVTSASQGTPVGYLHLGSFNFPMQPINLSVLDRSWLVDEPFHSFCQVLIRIIWCKSVSITDHEQSTLTLVNLPSLEVIHLKQAKKSLPKILQAFVWSGPRLWRPSYKHLVTLGTVFVLFLGSIFGRVVRFSLQVNSIRNYSW